MSMIAGETRYVLAGAFRRMAHVAWGDPANPAVLCVHGLSRTGRDFDVIAAALAERYYVVCPDLPGRGKSEWLADPALYHPVSYVQALAHLLAVIGRPVHWIGTSLGGIIGMLAGSMPGNPIRRLVLNDLGPFIPAAALVRIGTYLASQMEFPTLGALEAYLRKVHAPFGRLSDAQWRHLALTSARPLADGRVALHFDPAIATPFHGAASADADMWGLWEKVSAPVLALRGAESDLLLPETLARMASSGARVHEVPDCGHAPALMDAPTIAVVRGFLDEASG